MSRLTTARVLAAAATVCFLMVCTIAADAGETPDEVREVVLADLRLMDGEALSAVRAICVSGSVEEVKLTFERKHGSGSFPEIGEYCSTAIRTALERRAMAPLYYDLAVQQLGLGVAFSFETMRDAVGDGPVRVIEAVRQATETGERSYADLSGKVVDLGCPLALDVGATWGSANPTVAPDVSLTEEQLRRVIPVCYEGDTENVTLSTTGTTFTIQQIGLLAGEQLAREAAATGS